MSMSMNNPRIDTPPAEARLDGFVHLNLIPKSCENGDCPLDSEIVDTAIIKTENLDAYYENGADGQCPACGRDLIINDGIEFIGRDPS